MGVLAAYSAGMWHTYTRLWVVYAQAREGQRDWKYPVTWPFVSL